MIFNFFAFRLLDMNPSSVTVTLIKLLLQEPAEEVALLCSQQSAARKRQL